MQCGQHQETFTFKTQEQQLLSIASILFWLAFSSPTQRYAPLSIKNLTSQLSVRKLTGMKHGTLRFQGAVHKESDVTCLLYTFCATGLTSKHCVTVCGLSC